MSSALKARAEAIPAQRAGDAAPVWTALTVAVAPTDACFDCGRLVHRAAGGLSDPASCDPPSHGTAAERSRYADVTRAAADRLPPVLVQWSPDTAARGPLLIGPGEHTCFAAEEGRSLTLPVGHNFLVVVTATKAPKGRHWTAVPIWALPCAFGTDGRPVAARVNFHPSARALDDERLGRHALHHLFHGLGLDSLFRGPSLRRAHNSGLNREVDTFQGEPLVAWFRTATRCLSADGVPLDEEVRLRLFDTLGFESFEDHMAPGTAEDDSGCPDGTPAVAVDEERRSHVEPRVAVRDVSASPAASAVTALSVEVLRATGWYMPAATVPALLGQGCAINGRCSGLPAQFCFPRTVANTVMAATCADDARAVHRCDAAHREAFTSDAAAPYRYFPDPTVAGNNAAQDFCPAVVARTACAVGTRCLETGVHDGAACFPLRCPFGRRVVVVVDGTEVPCPAGATIGAAGIMCPPRGTVCGADVDTFPPALVWVGLSGHALEVASIPGAVSHGDAQAICGRYNGSLGFVPTLQFALEAALHAGVTAFWIGARSPTAWADTYGYGTVRDQQLLAGLGRLPSSGACAVFNATLRTVLAVPCDDAVVPLCTRQRPARDGPGVSVTIPGPATLTISTWSVYTQAAGRDRCGGSSGLLMADAAAVPAHELSRLGLTAGAGGVWTGLRHRPGSPRPLWATAVLDFSPSVEACFALGPASSDGAFLFPVGCSVVLPVLCAVTSVWATVPSSLPLAPRTLRVYPMALNATAAAVHCQAQGLRLAPVRSSSDAFAIASAATFPSVGPIRRLRVMGQVRGGVVSFTGPDSDQWPTPADARGSWLPAALSGDGTVALVATTGGPTFETVAPDLALPFVCGQTELLDSVADWLLVENSGVEAAVGRPGNATAASKHCHDRGGVPLGKGLGALAVADAARAFLGAADTAWTAWWHNGIALVDAVENGTVVSVAGAFPLGAPLAGECVAVAASGDFFGAHCAEVRPAMCQRPLVGPWRPLRPHPSSNESYEYAVTGRNGTLAQGRTRCAAVDGALAFLPPQGLALDVGDLNGTDARPLWSGVSAAPTATATARFDNTLHAVAFDQQPIAALCYSLDLADGSLTERPCGAVLHALCVRSRVAVEAALSLSEAFSGAVSAQPSRLSLRLPSNNSAAMTTAEVSLTTNVSKLQLSPVTLRAGTTADVPVSFDCGGRADPVVVELRAAVLSTTASIRRDVVWARPPVFVLWPCPAVASNGTVVGDEAVPVPLALHARIFRPAHTLTASLTPTGASLVCDRATVTFSATAPMQWVRCTGGEAGTGRVALHVAGCVPAHSCTDGAAMGTVASLRIRATTALTAATPATLLVGRSVAVPLTLTVSPSCPTNATVKALGGSVVAGARWAAVAAGAHRVTLLPTGGSVSLEVTVTPEMGCAEERLRPGAYNVLTTAAAAPTVALRITLAVLDPDPAGTSVVYAGQRCTLHIDATGMTAGTDVSVSVPSALLTTNATTVTLTPAAPSAEVLLTAAVDIARAGRDATFGPSVAAGAVVGVPLRVVPSRPDVLAPPTDPRLALRLVQRLTVVERPCRLFAGGRARAVVVRLPQTPVVDAVVLLSCEDAGIAVSDATMRWRGGQWGTHQPLRTASLRLPAHAVLPPDGRPVRCSFSTAAGASVSAHHLAPFTLTIASRSAVAFLTAPPPLALAGDDVHVAVLTPKSPFTAALVGLTTTSPPGLTAAIVAGGSSDRRTLSISVGPTAAGRRVCVAVMVNDTEHFVPLPDLCFAVGHVLAVALAAPLHSPQPIGVANAQTVSLELRASHGASTWAAAPMVGNVTLLLRCADAAVAAFEPSVVVWPRAPIPDGSTVRPEGPVLTASLSALHSGRRCSLQYRELVSPVGQLRDLTGPLGDPVAFVDVLGVALVPESPLTSLYAGGSNGTLRVAVPLVPSSDVRVVLDFDGPPDALRFDPAAVLFTNRSSSLETRVAVVPLRSAHGTVRVAVDTAAPEFNQTQAATADAAPIVVRPKVRVMVSGVEAVPTAYCVPGAAPVRATAALDAALPSNSSVVSVAVRTGDRRLVCTPSSRLLSNALRTTVFELSCDGVATAAVVRSVGFVVQGPPEVEGGEHRGSVSLGPQEALTVTQFPAIVTAGPHYQEVFTARPSRPVVPPTVLDLELRTDCGAAVAVSGSIGSVRWTAGQGPLSIPLVGLTPVARCRVALVQTVSSTAWMYRPEVFAANLSVAAPPQVTPDEVGPRVASDALGIAPLGFSVAHNTFREGSTVAARSSAAGAACVLVSSDGTADDATTVLALLHRTPGAVVLRVGKNGTRLEVGVTPDGAMRAAEVTEAVTLTFTRHCFVRDRAAPTPAAFTFFVDPPRPLAAGADVITAAVAVGAVASLVVGPAAAPQLPRLYSLLAVGRCPEPRWREERSTLTVVADPFGVAVGPVADLGAFLGAAVYDLLLVAAVTALHLFAAFFIFAARCNYAVPDRSFAQAAAIARFPCLSAFVPLYVAPLVVHFGVRVAVYSPAGGMQVAGAFCVAVAFVGVPVALGLVSRRAAAAYTVREVPEEGEPWWRRAVAPRGAWGVADDQWHGMFGRCYSQLHGPRWYGLAADVALSALLGAAAAMEPQSKGGCVAKFAALVGLFSVSVLVFGLLRPFRYEAMNAFFAALSAAQVASASASLSTLVGANAGVVTDGPAIATFVVGGLLICKAIGDLAVGAVKTLQYVRAKREAVRHTARFKVEATTVLPEMAAVPRRRLRSNSKAPLGVGDDGDGPDSLLALLDHADHGGDPWHPQPLPRRPAPLPPPRDDDTALTPAQRRFLATL